MTKKLRPAGLAITLLIGFITAGLVLGTVPASASTTTWKDPSNDAGELFTPPLTVPPQGGPSVLPSDPAFDVTDVTLEMVGDTFRWTVKVPKMPAGMPAPSTGYYFRLGFTHYGTQYQFMVVEDATGTQFRMRPWASPEWMPCKGCQGIISRQAKAVVVDAPIASLNEGFAAAGAPPVDGAEWYDLYVWSQRYVVGLSLTADTAIAPTGTVFAF